jgi:hypothetical protein
VDEIALPQGFCDLGASFWLRDYDWGRRAVPLSKLYFGICLTNEEKYVEPQSG